MNRLIKRALFEAPWWALFINPHFIPRRALYGAMSRSVDSLSGRVLDVGCGVQPYRHLMTKAREVVGLELDTPQNRAKKQADIFYEGAVFPFSDGHFDGILCNQVLEHVFDPTVFLDEIYRTMAPGGTLILSVPFVWPEHEQPWDCLRYTSFGLEDKLRAAGFHIDEHEKLVGGMSALLALLADGLNARIRALPTLFRLGLRMLCIPPISLVGVCVQPLVRADPNFYLDNFVRAHKPFSGE